MSSVWGYMYSPYSKLHSRSNVLAERLCQERLVDQRSYGDVLFCRFAATVNFQDLLPQRAKSENTHLRLASIDIWYTNISFGLSSTTWNELNSAIVEK